MAADDGRRYVVKSPDNPQGRRTLVNEWIGNWVFTKLGVATPPLTLLSVSEEFIEREDLHFVLSHKRRLRSGYHLGSLYPDGPSLIYDYVPSALMKDVLNLDDFIGALICDKWMGNTDYRQAIFVRTATTKGVTHRSLRGFRALMIDNGSLFDGSHWRFADSPIGCRPFYSRVYNTVRGWSDFDKWLSRVREISGPFLDEAILGIPCDWVHGDELQLAQLIDQLRRRVERLPDLLADLFAAVGPSLFPNWTSTESPIRPIKDVQGGC